MHTHDEKTEIEVKRIESESQQQIMHIGISQHELEGLMKTVAADSRLDFGAQSEITKQRNHSSKTKKLELAHEHPKLTLYLDQRLLAITKDCQARLRELQDSEDRNQAVAFLEDYGDGFAMQAVIGGRLFHSQNARMLEGDALDHRENTLKFAAEASLSQELSSKPTSIKSETKATQKDSIKTTSMSEGMFWCGVGGDPCLHGDPRAWITSMQDSKASWKIIKRRRVVSLPVILGRFSGFDWVPSKFEQLLRPTPSSLPDLALADESRIGMSSLALLSASFCEETNIVERRCIVYQDTSRYIKYGFIGVLPETSSRDDILVVDAITRARPNTPLVSSPNSDSSLWFVYVRGGTLGRI